MQLFAPSADARFRLAIYVIVVGVALLLVVSAGVTRSFYFTGVGVAREQPVPFSHKHHSGELGIDCRNCHAAVEVSSTAGLPQTWTCMTCHSQIWTNAAMLAPVRASLVNNEPLHWTRINRLPSYTYFNHSIHIAKGIGCSSCHGPVNTMNLMYKAHAFEMQFCLNCHRNPAQFVRPPEEIWNMEWAPPADQDTRGKALVLQYHISGPARLSDCSICHR